MMYWLRRIIFIARDRLLFWRPPTPPENVRLIYPDGRVVAMECVYGGRIKGLHAWISAYAVPYEPEMALAVGMLPARSLIRVRLTGPPDDYDPAEHEDAWSWQ